MDGLFYCVLHREDALIHKRQANVYLGFFRV